MLEFTLEPILPVVAAALGPAASAPCPAQAAAPPEGVGGFGHLVAVTFIPKTAADQVLQDLLNLGAVHVQELTRNDWAALPSFAALLPLQQRRLLFHCFGS